VALSSTASVLWTSFLTRRKRFTRLGALAVGAGIRDWWRERVLAAGGALSFASSAVVFIAGADDGWTSGLMGGGRRFFH
jgi:hypothetical protein